MPADFYRVLHLVGVFMVLMSLGALIIHAVNGGEKQHKGRKLTMIFHGVGLLIVLVGGFGLLAKLKPGGEMFPNWAFIKLGIWLVLGGLVAIIARKQAWAKGLWFVVWLLASAAAFVGIYWDALWPGA